MFDDNCIFCKIVHGEIPAHKLLDESECLAIADINPQAPFHALVIPKTHMRDITQCSEPRLLVKLFQVANQLVKDHGLTKGFRLVINTGEEGGQTVDHLHVHVLSGRTMHWPPG